MYNIFLSFFTSKHYYINTVHPSSSFALILILDSRFARTSFAPLKYSQWLRVYLFSIYYTKGIHLVLKIASRKSKTMILAHTPLGYPEPLL